ncbi:hypothetical protein [Brevibacillus thermoruber]|uniref:hypothetical protein n=1 Tax=Brevibacillus thermoruber TaxID=33942 RepID=UPI0012E09A97|nr:hypothetical protein [Brevibacillus thermoruber]
MYNEQRPFRISYKYGKADLHEIVNDLARQTIIKSVGNFATGNSRVKKIPRYVQVV